MEHENISDTARRVHNIAHSVLPEGFELIPPGDDNPGLLVDGQSSIWHVISSIESTLLIYATSTPFCALSNVGTFVLG
ncbi:MAG: hypothetical protein HRT90_07740 [Candidatus Margulisbacteria bacterium]|nr:hypothetical protein [Candidatus Margulisiibacteriota bacterium]